MKKSILVIMTAALCLLTGCKDKTTYDYPFQNPRLSVDERVENLISLLTPEEKVGLMMNGSISIDRLGIPAYNWWSEACHGICADDATVFPQAIGLAATFDAEQQFQIYTAVSDEARAQWNTTEHNQFGKTKPDGSAWHRGLSFWCPNINIFRDPRWGRGQETSGEDPYLSGVMGSQVVLGMQGNDPKYYKTHTCAKHYAVHSGPESGRHRDDVSVSMRDLWETYLPAFRTLVKDAGVQEVMCAYNRYEGDPCCGSERLLTDILRNKWGYDDIILSDCGAIGNFYNKGQHETHPDAAHASADAVLAGTDLECGTSYEALTESLEKGLISEADLDASLRRILRGRIELGTLDPAEDIPWAGLGKADISSPEHTALALKAAREAMVLLKNNGVLPLSKDIKKIAVVGPNADNETMHLGNYNGRPTKENSISIVNAIRKAIPGAEVIYDKGCDFVDEYMTDYLLGSVNDGKGLYGEFFNNPTRSGEPVVKNYYNNINMRTYGEYRFDEGVERNNFSARFTGTFKADYTGELFYTLNSSDVYKFTVNGKVISEAKTKPEGFSRRRMSGIPTTSFKVEAGKTYNIELEFANTDPGFSFLTFDICKRYLPDFNALAERVKDADAIIVVSGITARLEGEEMPVSFDGFSGGDRTKIELPKVQEKLIAAMDATGKPVVLVNCSGSAIGFGAIETEYDALLQAWYAGQAEGIAVADVLFGDYNPAGRLPVTFYASTDQLPEFTDYNMEGRTYRYFRGNPLYAFGYGLSYTSFEYGAANISKSEIKAGKGVDITIPVTNTGELDGDEVVQVYVKALDNPTAPIKSLKGFKRVNIPAGKTVKVTISLAPEAFEYYDETIDELSVRKGSYQLLYGASSNDFDLKAVELSVI